MNLTPVIRQQFFDGNGDPLAGGFVYTYAAGTSTLQPTYTDQAGGTPNANPVVLDANGVASIWTDPSLSYKFVIQNSSGATIQTIDNVIGLLTADAVSTESLQARSVTGAKIALNTIAGENLKSSASVDADRPVGTDNIKDANVTRAKLAVGAVPKLNVVSKTAAYTLTSDDDMVLVSGASGAYTLTLPTAVGISGKRYWIKRTDSTYANVITIDGAGSETIGGSLTKPLHTQDEMWQIVSDGSNWQVVEHKTATPWTAFTLTPGAVTTAPTKGTVAVDAARWRRVGDSLELVWEYKHTAAGTGGSGAYLVSLPNSFAIDTTKLSVPSSVITDLYAQVGDGALFDGAATYAFMKLYAYNTTQIFGRYIFDGSSAAGGNWGSGFKFDNTTYFISLKVTGVPISGWEA